MEMLSGKTRLKQASIKRRFRFSRKTVLCRLHKIKNGRWRKVWGLAKHDFDFAVWPVKDTPSVSLIRCLQIYKLCVSDSSRVQNYSS